MRVGLSGCVVAVGATQWRGQSSVTVGRDAAVCTACAGVVTWEAMPSVFPHGLDYFYNVTGWPIQVLGSSSTILCSDLGSRNLGLLHVLCCAVLCCAVPVLCLCLCCAVLCCACAVLCCACAVLCCAVLMF